MKKRVRELRQSYTCTCLCATNVEAGLADRAMAEEVDLITLQTQIYTKIYGDTAGRQQCPVEHVDVP